MDESPEASIENEENTNKLNIVRGGRKRTPKEGGTKKYEPVKKNKHLKAWCHARVVKSASRKFRSTSSRLAASSFGPREPKSNTHI